MKWKINNFIILFFIIFLFSCHSVTSFEQETDFNIKDILNKIQYNLNFAQPDSINLFIHENFSHKGRDKKEEENFFMDLSFEYTFFSFKNIEIQRLSYTRAIAKFDMVLQNNTQILKTFEPSEIFGDLSYFYYENGRWYLIGKDNFKKIQ